MFSLIPRFQGYNQWVLWCLWGMSCAPLWQAGYGHSRPTCNHEAQQGSVKLNFLHRLRLLTSTGVSVNLTHHRMSIWFCKKEGEGAYHLHCHLQSWAEKKMVWHKRFGLLNSWFIMITISSPALLDCQGITVILCRNRLGRLDTGILKKTTNLTVTTI